MVGLKVNNYEDREKLIIALANSGYTIRVEKRKVPNSYPWDYDYYVIIENGVFEPTS